MRIAAVIILYNPPDFVFSNIKTYYDHVEKLFVFDNSETESSIKNDLANLSKVEFYHDFQNKGIAERLNAAAQKSKEQGFDWLLTMDQDTSFPEGVINNYFSCAANYSNKVNVAMFGTNSERKNSDSRAECVAEEEDEIITSGSLLNLALTNTIGAFDEQLFIDYVDNDYCYRAIYKGYLIIKFKNINLVHELGKMVYHASIKSLYLWKKKKVIHPPIRCYYLYRNMLYLENKYKPIDIKLSKKIRKDITIHVRKSVLYGKEGWKAMQYVLKAKSDYKANRMGKIDEGK